MTDAGLSPSGAVARWPARRRVVARLCRGLGGDRRVRHGARACSCCPTSPTGSGSPPGSPASSSSCPRRGTSSSTPSPGGSATGTCPPAGRRRPFLAARRDRARGLLRAALRRPAAPRGARRHLGRRRLPRLRHRLRLLPGPLRRDAGRDDRRLRRAHPADDVARGHPRARHPRQRGLGAGDPRRRRAGAGLPRHGRRRGPAHPRRRASAPGAAPPRAPVGTVRPSGGSLRRPAAHRRRPAATSAPCSARSSSRRSRPARCSPASTTSPGTSSARRGRVDRAVRLLRRRRRCSSPRSGSGSAPGAASAGGMPPRRSCSAAARSRWWPARSMPSVVVYLAVARRRRRLRGRQMFPLAMLPDVAADDAAPLRREPHRRLHRRVDRRRDARAGPRAGALRARARPGRLRLVDGLRCGAARLGRDGDRARLLRRAGRAGRAQPAAPAAVPSRRGRSAPGAGRRREAG